MKNATARTTYLKDYRAPDFLIDHTDLHFDLHEDHALVTSTLTMRSNDEAEKTDSLQLHGEKLELVALALNDRTLEPGEFTVDDESLTVLELRTLLGVPAEQGELAFTLRCVTRIEPQKNTALEGLYKSKTMFCTQCEAEGFRRITYYLDRPDVMSRFCTTVEAERQKYPVLLSNGNNVASGESEKEAGRHWCRWEDPFKKPSYLFALVAGDLEKIEDRFMTMSGREIKLQIFVEEKDLDKCTHAMNSLKNAMAWDEQVYGREYDLDIFMIVAVDDFNMGAMENKGLNIFNTSCVLANPSTQTDQAFQRVEAVVAHEYFHNWSGNRVTCRDWFQLSLKEGFTVYRDSEFSADMGSRTVKRVEDVAFLRTVQFAEDAGPMAHPVRPDSYMEIANFYTVTIYEKGAEVVRMLNLLVGDEGFRRGTDLYFDRHDGQAVTTEEFVRAIEDANQLDLEQFRRWYFQAGTPVLDVQCEYNSDQRIFTLDVKQSCPATPGQTEKLPFHIPLRVGLVGKQGNDLPLRLAGETVLRGTDLVLQVTEPSQQFVFEDVEEEPVASLLRGFSAPVRLQANYSIEQLAFLMAHDGDGFNRWNAGQMMAGKLIGELLDASALRFPELLGTAFGRVLDSAIADVDADRAGVAQLLTLPPLASLIEQAKEANVDRLHEVREFLLDQLAEKLEDKFAALLKQLPATGDYVADAQSIGNRALRNLCLTFLARGSKQKWLSVVQQQFEQANNMTDQSAALRILAHGKSPQAQALAEPALVAFYQQWQHEPLVVDQWLSVQATSPTTGALAQVKKLMQHEAFQIRNPNKVRALIGAFCGQNHINFHAISGEGYEFLADRVIELDQLNPQIASRLLTPLTRWRKFDPVRQALMQAQLQRIKALDGLSKDVFEVVEKSTL